MLANTIAFIRDMHGNMHLVLNNQSYRSGRKHLIVVLGERKTYLSGTSSMCQLSDSLHYNRRGVIRWSLPGTASGR